MWQWVGLGLLAMGLQGEEADPLQTFRSEFVAITPGEGSFPPKFSQGDSSIAIAQPLREVTLSHSFAIARYEVTQALWEKVMGTNPSRWKGPRNSVEMLSYEDAVAFCRKATALLRERKLIEPTQWIRLPSESEWEYCCRAGTASRYSFGDKAEDLDEYGWHTGNAAGNDPPVGARKPNPWGLYDMHGYLKEWCADTGHDDYKNAPVSGEAWLVGSAVQRVVRGGSWKDKATECASASRQLVPTESKDDAIGLRCVLASVPVEPTPFRPTDSEAILAPDAQLELLWGEGEFTEGPALAPDGSILFSDIGNRMMRFEPKTQKTSVFREPSGRSNGLMFDQQGNLLACEGANTGGGRRISLTEGIQGEKDGTVRALSQGIGQSQFNSPNDMTIGPDGTVYFSDPRYVGDDPRDLDFEGVFAVSTTGETTTAITQIEKPNGLAISSAGHKLYVADNNPAGNRQLVVFALNVAEPNGNFGSKEILWDFQAGRGIDGMTTDVQGNIYATAGTGKHAGVYVFDPQGKPLAMIPTPGDPTNCCFGGGDDQNTLYVTAALDAAGSKYGLFRIPLKTKGYHVVKLNSPPAGLPTPSTPSTPPTAAESLESLESPSEEASK